MPELPEVETVVRTLAPHLVGWSIKSISTTASRVFREQQSLLAATLPGCTVRAVRRYGKNILIEFDENLLRVHLGMTGKLLFATSDAEAMVSTHPHATLWLTRNVEDGPERGREKSAVLVFDDTRQFGRFELMSSNEGDSLALGPEPLEVSLDEFVSLLKSRGGAIKSVLLNQRVLRGLGNIYTDEALFLARIHPLTAASRVKRAKAALLHESIRLLLNEAIASGGSSISDYVDSEGRRGDFQDRHQVYGKEGEPCSRCNSAIRRIVVGQRGTHFCPRCQVAPRQL